MHGGTSSSLCVRAKTRQILACGERYANHLQTVQAQVCSPVYTNAHLVCKLFASGLRTIRHARVHEAQHSLADLRFKYKETTGKQSREGMVNDSELEQRPCRIID